MKNLGETTILTSQVQFMGITQQSLQWSGQFQKNVKGLNNLTWPYNANHSINTCSCWALGGSTDNEIPKTHGGNDGDLGLIPASL